jgi:hypothetical protein
MFEAEIQLELLELEIKPRAYPYATVKRLEQYERIW